MEQEEQEEEEKRSTNRESVRWCALIFPKRFDACLTFWVTAVVVAITASVGSCALSDCVRAIPGN